MDASQYKVYVLGIFVTYVSDKYANDSNALIDVPKGRSFRDFVALKVNKEIGEMIETTTTFQIREGTVILPPAKRLFLSAGPVPPVP